MTSALEQIAEEMERHPTAQHAMNGYAARIRAWVAANQESPQRKAFVEAAMRLHYFSVNKPSGDLEVKAAEKARIAFFWTGRAMIDAEKVEAERGEGMVK